MRDSRGDRLPEGWVTAARGTEAAGTVLGVVAAEVMSGQGLTSRISLEGSAGTVYSGPPDRRSNRSSRKPAGSLSSNSADAAIAMTFLVAASRLMNCKSCRGAAPGRWCSVGLPGSASVSSPWSIYGPIVPTSMSCGRFERTGSPSLTLPRSSRRTSVLWLERFTCLNLLAPTSPC